MADKNHWHLTNTYSNQDDIILRREATGEWIANVSDVQMALDHEAGHAQQQAMDDSERVRKAATADSQIRVLETALASQADYDVFLQSLPTDVVLTWRWEVASKVRLGDLPIECAVLLECINASPMVEKSPNTEAFLFDAEATFALYCNHRFGATIGALTALFEQSLVEWLNAVRDARRCVHDPVCRHHGGNCHVCTHLAETSCRFFNLNLGRSFLFGGPDPELAQILVGYFDPSSP